MDYIWPSNTTCELRSESTLRMICTHCCIFQGFSRVTGCSKCHGSGRVESGSVQYLSGRVASGQEVIKSRGSGRVGSGRVKRFSYLAGRVGSSQHIFTPVTRGSGQHDLQKHLAGHAGRASMTCQMFLLTRGSDPRIRLAGPTRRTFPAFLRKGFSRTNTQ